MNPRDSVVERVALRGWGLDSELSVHTRDMTLETWGDARLGVSHAFRAFIGPFIDGMYEAMLRGELLP